METRSKKEIQVNTSDNNGNTCLHFACARNNIEMVKLLLKFGNQDYLLKKLNKTRNNRFIKGMGRRRVRRRLFAPRTM